MSERRKKAGLITATIDFLQKYGRVITSYVVVAGVAYGIGFKHSHLLREREIMRIENQHSAEILNLKEEYMEKYYSLRERIQIPTPNDSTDESKSIYRQH